MISTPGVTESAGQLLWLRIQRGVTSSGRTEYSHSGAFGLGAAANFVVLPSEDLAIIALTNAGPIGVPETLTAEFMDLVQYGQVREDWAALYKKAFAPLNELAGSLVGKQSRPTQRRADR